MLLIAVIQLFWCIYKYWLGKLPFTIHETFLTWKITSCICICKYTYVCMWPYLQEGVLYTHHFNIKILLPFKSHINLTVHQSAFPEAAFQCMSDIHKCLDCLHLPLLAIDEKQPGCKLPHNWLVMLSTDLTTFGLSTASMSPYEGVTTWCIFSATLWLPITHDQPTLCYHLWYWLKNILNGGQFS